ncbi:MULTISPECIES: COX15/CtaA family protein [unclassified Sphingomonas]|uniref:COX15/CtaA family protein n=1 Tax=unclassified Sphingomonas TaxID=196159 RepID=UPI0006FD302F|nr:MULTISPECIES: COX15/CtaA family protein [unclassified Sphingomonas]KQX19077.1 heme A synthase [Sphingomonas sp. Root1294]KQY65278.1 heme A synthase [Sphingomonas sp. Root50]KRB95427.1 heme A synthase [Sphingomonas sp. Root720]
MSLLARPALPSPRPRALADWLLFVAALVFAIVVVGGITRLTESGLSITEWKPVRGIIPPLDQAEWQAEFENYQRIPQYAAFNLHMTLEGFKQIYFWEYLHRLLARGIGAVLAAVMVVAWWKRAIPAGYGWRMIGIFALGGLQGAIGWWMVYSGLSARTEVSHIRLATHLIAALLIFSALIWTVLDLRRLARDAAARPARPTGLAIAAVLILAVQIMLGAFVAGLRAGYAFASWPKMGEQWFPSGGWNAALGFANLHDNPIVVQFVHRWWAWVAALAALAVARAARAAGAVGPVHAVATLVVLQIGLGVATLLTGVDISVAVAHQAVAVLLLAGLLWAAHGLDNRKVS